MYNCDLKQILIKNAVIILESIKKDRKRKKGKGKRRKQKGKKIVKEKGKKGRKREAFSIA